MFRNKANKPEYANPRNLLISFVPEKLLLPDQKFFTQDWAEHFGRRLALEYPDARVIKVVIDGKAFGYPAGDTRNLPIYGPGYACGDTKYSTAPCITDFLVLHNLDYAEAPPPRLSEILADMQSAQGQDKTLLWAVLLDTVEFFASRFGECDVWHVLRGEGKNGRFKELDEKGCRDEQEDAAKLIRCHPACHIPSPVCPRHQATGRNFSLATRIRKKLFGRHKP